MKPETLTSCIVKDALVFFPEFTLSLEKGGMRIRAKSPVFAEFFAQERATRGSTTRDLATIWPKYAQMAATLALRTQQVIAEETGVTNTIDPLGGSYFVEALTSQMEEEASNYIHKIDELGGIVRAMEIGYPQQEIANAAYAYQKKVERKEKIVVGVNKYQVDEEKPLEYLKIDPEVEEKQVGRLKEVKRTRNNARVQACLGDLKKASKGSENLMPYLLAAVKEYASLQEVCDVFRGVFGAYRDPGMF